MHRKRQESLSSNPVFGVNQPLIRRQTPGFGGFGGPDGGRAGGPQNGPKPGVPASGARGARFGPFWGPGAPGGKWGVPDQVPPPDHRIPPPESGSPAPSPEFPHRAGDPADSRRVPTPRLVKYYPKPLPYICTYMCRVKLDKIREM